MLETIYKEAIKKEIQKVYDLWWKELVKIQASFVKELEKWFNKYYLEVLNQIKNNIEVQMNDWLLESVKKTYAEDELEVYNKYFEKSFSTGAKKLDLSTSKEPWVDIKIWIKQQDAVDYAEKYAGDRIANIDEYSRTRINKLVNHGISEWWWYNRIAKVLKKDYAFSSYRANLVASHEVGEAYLNWKTTQFSRYRKEFGVDGWKNWTSHRDDKTTEWCMHNDMQWWIPFSDPFEASWNTDKPTRFIWCRCNVVFNIFKPKGARVTKKNVQPHMLTQSVVKEDRWFDAWIKPENYNKYSTSVLPASYINHIWKPSKFVWKWRWYFKKASGQRITEINLWKRTASAIEKKFTEVHEVWHFFFEEKVMKDEKNLKVFLDVFKKSWDELSKLTSNKDFYKIVTTKYSNVASKLLKENIDDIKIISSYKIIEWTKNIKRRWNIYKVATSTATERFAEETGAFLDTVGALNKERFYGAGHWYRYYTSQINNELLVGASWQYNVTRKQAHEFFAHLNETHFIWNDVIKTVMPDTYDAMIEFYNNIWLTFE